MRKYYITENKTTKSLFQKINLKVKVKELFLEALCLILLGLTIYLCFRNYSLSKQLSRYQPKTNDTTVKLVTNADKKYMGSSKQETLIQSTKDKFSLAPDYSGHLNPKNITYWNTNDFNDRSNHKNPVNATLASSSKFDSVNNISLNQAAVNSSKVLSDISFKDLGIYSNDSLVQILFDRNQIQLASYNFQSHSFITRNYNLDFNKYSYNWNPNSGLTYKRVYPVRILPYVGTSYKIFNKEFHIGTGIMISTYRLDYSLEGALEKSIGTHNNIKADIEIGIRYKLNPWLK